MGSVLNDVDRAEICGRLARVTSESAPRWGAFDAAGMLNHLRLSALMALGELSVASKNKRAFQMFPLKHLILHVIPFPKGAPTAAELLVAGSAPLEGLRSEVASLVARIGAGPRTGEGPVHPLFGRLSRSEWGVLMYKHADHHLRQFGA